MYTDSICKFVFLLQYDGTNYYGFQRQKNKFQTIQGELEKAFLTIFKEKITVHPAGRTDSKVHAVGQVIHIQMSSLIVEKNFLLLKSNKLIYYLNFLLPLDIRVLYFQKVVNSFHARYSCMNREYKYIIYNSPFASCFFQKYSLWIQQSLNLNAMQKASIYLTGKHDYSSFTKNKYQKSHTSLFREIEYINIQKVDNFIIFSIRGKSFLHNMVRIIIGTLLEVGRGKKESQELEIILLNKDRRKAGQTLAPHGLFFYKANYEEFQYPKSLLQQDNLRIFPILF